MIYLDSSALLKLLIREAETDALTSWLTESGVGPRATSELAIVECARAIRAANSAGRIASEFLAAQLGDCTRLLTNLDLIPVTRGVLEAAGELSTGLLRSLDAIHVATADRYRADLEALLTYDVRMIAAAAAQGLPTASPGASPWRPGVVP